MIEANLATDLEKEMVDRGELNSRHRDFQFYDRQGQLDTIRRHQHESEKLGDVPSWCPDGWTPMMADSSGKVWAKSLAMTSRAGLVSEGVEAD
jgi:hypothetical protein